MQPISLLQSKRIVLAVTGSIACYKALDFASKLTQAGAEVDVILSQAAQRFVTPLAFQALTGRPVYQSMWQADHGGGLPTHIAHVGLGEKANLIAVVPATAHTIAKLAHGFADDLLSVTALAARCPLLIAPAMDGGMYEHPATQANITVLQARGAYWVDPDIGRFASGLHGRGRLPDTATLLGHVRRALAQEGALSGRHVVISAGPTREAFDPVRFISNQSSGKQGYAIAQAALDVGARVTLISSVSLAAPIGATVLEVDSAQSMQAAVTETLLKHPIDALIMAAAVADFRPATVAEQKIKKSDDGQGMTVALARNPDILKTVQHLRQESAELNAEQRANIEQLKVVVGFAAESENLLANAQRKVQAKGLDFIVANDISATDAGFAVDTNRVVFLHSDGTQTPFDLMSKTQVAEHIMAQVTHLLTNYS